MKLRTAKLSCKEYVLARPPCAAVALLTQVFRFDQSIAHVANSLVGPLKGETRPLLGCAGKRGEVSERHGSFMFFVVLFRVPAWVRACPNRPVAGSRSARWCLLVRPDVECKHSIALGCCCMLAAGPLGGGARGEARC